jgi:phosphoesterase RecJ-like protein
MIDWSRFKEIIGAHHRFVLTSHVRPDCDALGSELAMAGVLESLGKEVLIVNGFAPSPTQRFIDPEFRLKQLGVDVTPEIIETYEVLMILDTSAWAQLEPVAAVLRSTRLKKIVLDHHVSADDLGAEMFKNTEAEATGRLVVDAADQLGVELSQRIAMPAFVALATDTGWFRFGSTSSGTLRMAARLVDAGAKPDQIYKDLYEHDTFGRLKLMGASLARAQKALDGRLIYTWIEQTDFANCGAIPSDSEDLINILLSVDGSEAALILVEQKSGGFKISFRSRCQLDCARVAEQFGGGGHKKAAGAFLADPLPVARAKTLDAMIAAMG